MKAVVQRVLRASVIVNDSLANEIGRGLLVFAGFGPGDSEIDSAQVAGKIARLRIFPDGEKESALSAKDIGGEVLLISQFTLFADTQKGNRPSFSEAMPAKDAKKEFDRFTEKIRAEGLTVKTGVFQAMMRVSLENDGPYTILLDSKKGKA